MVILKEAFGFDEEWKKFGRKNNWVPYLSWLARSLRLASLINDTTAGRGGERTSPHA